MFVKYTGTAEMLERDGIDAEYHSSILGKVGRRGPAIGAVNHKGELVRCVFVNFPEILIPFVFEETELEEVAAPAADPTGDACTCILAMGEIMRDAHGTIGTDKVVSTAEIAARLGWPVERVQSAMYALAAAGLVDKRPGAKGQT